MTISSLKCEFTVNSIPFSKDFNTRLNIKKRVHYPVFKSLSSKDKINISYTGGQEILPKNNLFISDRSTVLTQNRIPSTSISLSTINTISIGVDKFLVTDVFTEDNPTRPKTPLFYVHTLENFNPDNDDWGTKTLISFEFLDKNFLNRKLIDYIIDKTTGEIFNNFKNEFDASTLDYSVTFVKYVVSFINGSVNTYHELINNEKIFKQADFDDIDEYGAIISGRKVYLIEEIVGGESFSVTLPVSDLYAYQELPESRLKIKNSTALDTTVPWYVSILNGKFIANLPTSNLTSDNFKYSIAEFDAQTFNPYPPYKLKILDQALWLNPRLLKFTQNIVNNPTAGFYIDIIVFDEDDEVVYAITTNEDKIGDVYINDINWSSGIASVDQSNGFVELTISLKDVYSFQASYFYEEKEYEFTNIDFNPINNLDILDQRIIIYINPETTFTGELDNSLNYLIVNQLGEILYASQADDPGSLISSTQKLIDEDFSTDGIPKHLFYYDKPSTLSGLSWRPSGLYSQFESDFSFLDKYTVNSILITNPVIPSGGHQLVNYQENPRFLVLGDLYVGEFEDIKELEPLDVRIEGGGIKEDLIDEAIDIQPEVAWFLNVPLIQQYPAATTFMAEIPNRLLQDNDGDFTLSQIKDIISRHIPAGTYPIIKTYGIDPQITYLLAGSGQVLFNWPSYGGAVNYNIYYSTTNLSGSFVTYNSDQIDLPGGNSVTITGLIPSTKYYVKIGAIDSNDIESFSPTVSFTTTAVTSS